MKHFGPEPDVFTDKAAFLLVSNNSKPKTDVMVEATSYRTG